MSLRPLIDALRQRSRTLLRAGFILLVLLFLFDALPFFVDKSKAHTTAERLPGFWSAFGLAGAFLLIFTAKTLGSLGLQKPEEEDDD